MIKSLAMTQIFFGGGDVAIKSSTYTENETGEEMYGLGFTQIKKGDVNRSIIDDDVMTSHDRVDLVFNDKESIETINRLIAHLADVRSKLEDKFNEGN